MSNRAPFLLGVVAHPNRQPDAVKSEAANAAALGGLGQCVRAHVYPFPLLDVSFVLGLGPNAAKHGTLQFQPEGQGWFSLDIQLLREKKGGHDQSIQMFQFWNKYNKPTISEPCSVRVSWRHWKKVEYLGRVAFDYTPAPPLSAEQYRLIDAMDEAKRIVARAFRCPECGDQISTYTSTRKLQCLASNDPRRHWLWYRDLPDLFVCRCQRTAVNLTYLRESMHHCLLTLLERGPSLESAPAVSLDNLASTIAVFEWLLAKEPNEEQVQTFLQDNDRLLRFAFGARQILPKPPILNQYRADFGVVNSRNELLLIEIERPSLQLFRADGVCTAALTQSFAQTEAWHQVLTEHRAAVLDHIESCPKSVTRIKYLVIAGNSAACEPRVLERFMLVPRLAEFMTYDQLIGHVRNAFRIEKN